ncbi:MAG: hypothetical protein MI922_12510, partial [Bacteroidales bacterium]|nr:hypothetical protein [Bacteroidales bacterium]
MTKIIFILVSIVILTGCKNNNPVPKPRGYFRMEFPDKKYREFSSGCPFLFEIPTYGTMNPVLDGVKEPCWYNLSFTDYSATVYLTYKKINDNLGEHIEDVRTIVYKHTIKANDI